MPKINPVAGLEPITGTISKDPADSDFTLGGLCSAPRITSGKSFCGQSAPEVKEMESCPKTETGKAKNIIARKVSNPYLLKEMRSIPLILELVTSANVAQTIPYNYHVQYLSLREFSGLKWVSDSQAEDLVMP
jgi:hypothetical protein